MEECMVYMESTDLCCALDELSSLNDITVAPWNVRSVFPMYEIEGYITLWFDQFMSQAKPGMGGGDVYL